jgi:hypothetical protein
LPTWKSKKSAGKSASQKAEKSVSEGVNQAREKKKRE